MNSRHRVGPTPDQYASWRASIPFTDEDIASAIDAEAAALLASNRYHGAQTLTYVASRVRIGRVSGFAIRVAMDRLVTKCALCSKKALYRIGHEGRCSEHKTIRPGWAVVREANMDNRHIRAERMLADDDRIKVAAERFKRGRGARRSSDR